MKKTTLLICLLANLMIFAQTTFTFTGNANDQGDWTNPANWSGNNAPGLTVNASDTIELDGTVTIFSGVNIINNGTIITLNGSTGSSSLDIRASGSLTNSTSATIDIDNGTLDNAGTFENNGTITSNNTVINNSGTFTNNNSFSNITSSTPIFTNSGVVTNGSSGNMTLNAQTINQDSFTNNGTITTTRDFENQNTFTNTGTFTASDGGNLENGDSQNASALTINSGSIIITTTSSVTQTQISNFGNLTNQAGGTISLINDSTLRIFELSTLINLGTITNTSGTIDVKESFVNDGVIINDDSIIMDVGESITNNGSLTNNGDISGSSNSLITSVNGSLSGINTSHQGNIFTFEGTLSPGNTTNATGTYTFGDDLTLQSDASLNVEIAALTDFDNVISSDDITLSGTLNVTLLNGYEPVVGDTFEIVSAASILNSSTFATENLPTLPTGRAFEVDYSSTNSVVLNVVSTLSTNDFTKNSFKIYPNPSETVLHINALNTTEKAIIYNHTGQRLFSKEVTPVNNKIDTSSLASGIYFITIRNASQKFIKL